VVEEGKHAGQWVSRTGVEKHCFRSFGVSEENTVESKDNEAEELIRLQSPW